MGTSMIQEEEEEISPDINVLGPFCKLTHVHLWDDDDSVGVQSGSFSKLDKPSHIDEFGSSDSISEFLHSPEDLELSRQMNELGLPVSFQTNKEKKTASRRKRKDPKKKNLHKETNDNVLSSFKESEEGDASSIVLNDSESNALCSISMLGLSEQSYFDLEVKTNTSDLHKETNDNVLSSFKETEEGDASSAVCNDSESNALCSISMLGLSEQSYFDLEVKTNTSDEISNQVLDYGLDYDTGLPSDLLGNDIVVEEVVQRLDDECSSGCCLIDGRTDEKKSCYACTEASLMEENKANSGILAAADSQSMQLVDFDTADNNHRGAFGDWRAYWDHHYMRTYFYNIITEESTWDPPPGVEADLSDNGLYNVKFTESNSSSGNSFPIANGRKERKTTNGVKQSRGIIGEISPSINKYWLQRYRLFSRFNEGIQMDEEGWFSVTPERIAKHHACRCAGGVIVDCFAGVGGNAIQFAQSCQHVIAIDIDPRKIEYARHNAAVYGVEDLIDFVVGDCILVAPKFKADTVFLSPPWGGPDYAKVEVFDINVMLQPYNGHFLFEVARLIAPKVVMFLPRNVNVNQLVELALSANPPYSLEVETNYLNGKMKAITAYFTQRAA